MGDYRHDYAVIRARKQLELMNQGEDLIKEFDALCEDFGLTVADATGWQEEEIFFNPQTI